MIDYSVIIYWFEYQSEYQVIDFQFGYWLLNNQLPIHWMITIYIPSTYISIIDLITKLNTD